MARSDLLIALVKAASGGDKRAFRSAVEAVIAEERAKQHNILADRLTNALQVSPVTPLQSTQAAEASVRARDFIHEVVPECQLSDLILSEDCARAVEQLVEEHHRAGLLQAHGLNPRNRVLLVGPPGNGKTSLAEAVAEQLAVPMFVVRYETMVGSFLGETASRLKRVFDYARTSPCVLFFDEFDAVGKERGDTHETGEIKRVVTSLLMQIDDLPSYTVVIAATNHPELLDRAVWRRFQIRLNLPAPTKKQLVRYVEDFLQSVQDDANVSSIKIVERLGSVSFAEIEQFALDVKRRMILSYGTPFSLILEDQLKLWELRTNQPVISK